MTANLLRSLARLHATSVTVVTAAGSPPAGFTATSFTSVSLSPPLVSFCLGRGTSAWPTVIRAGHVAVHLLGEHQQGLARTFATSGIDRFSKAAWRTGPYGVPLLEGAVGWVLCRVVRKLPVGDHTLVLAEPVLGETADGPPLLYHMGGYVGVAS